MKRAMLITVGSGPGVENAIAYSIRLHNPDLVFFCCSDKTKETIEKVKQILNAKLTENSIRPKVYPEVNDFENIFDTYCGYIDDLVEQGFTHDEIVADYTSGTRAMSAAMATAAIIKKLYSVCYVYSWDRDDIYGRSETPGMKASSLTPNLIYTKQRLDFARKYFNKLQFDTAMELAKKDVHPKYKEEADWLSLIIRAYQAWDVLHYQQAREIFEKLDNHPITVKYKLKGTITKHKKLTGHLLSQIELYNKGILDTAVELSMPNHERNRLFLLVVFDLIDNAQRRFYEGKYDDAVARLYRALEHLAQIEFLKVTGYVNSKCPLNKLPELIQQEFAKLVENGKITLALMQTYSALDELSNNLGEKFQRQKNKWLAQIEKRNNSIFAHGLKPVGKENYIEFLNMIKDLIPDYSFSEWPKL